MWKFRSYFRIIHYKDLRNENLSKYEDIINLDHPVSKKHKQMSLNDRAAQFSPFAALTGFEEETDETARLTESKKYLDESQKEYISYMLNQIMASEDKSVIITYFVADGKKEGGSYQLISGKIKKIDMLEKMIYMETGEKIELENIFEIDQIS